MFKIAFEKQLQTLFLKITIEDTTPNFNLFILGKNCNVNMMMLNVKSLCIWVGRVHCVASQEVEVTGVGCEWKTLSELEAAAIGNKQCCSFVTYWCSHFCCLGTSNFTYYSFFSLLV